MTAIRTASDPAPFRAAARARDAARRVRLVERRLHALSIARQAAELLKTRYGATRVLVFGSTSRDVGYHERSDLDLAAWGLSGRAYWAALAALEDLDPALDIELIRAETAAPSLLAAVEAEGVVP